MADVVDEAHEIAGLLFGATELTRQRFETMCAGFDVTPVQARALMALGAPVPMRGLADILRCDPSNVTGIADRLEHRGLVRREADPTDRRVKSLVATNDGHRMRRALERALLDSSPFLTALTARERTLFHKLLEKINRAAETDGE